MSGRCRAAQTEPATERTYVWVCRACARTESYMHLITTLE